MTKKYKESQLGRSGLRPDLEEEGLMAKRETEKEEIKEQLTPFKALLVALVESGLIQGEADIFAYRAYPDAPVHTYRDLKTNIVHENVRIDAWDRGCQVITTSFGPKIRIISKQGGYYVRTQPGVELPLTQWVAEYKLAQQHELDQLAAERAKK